MAESGCLSVLTELIISSIMLDSVATLGRSSAPGVMGIATSRVVE